MKKIYALSICLLVLIVPFWSEAAASASGKTQSDVTFIQGEQPKKPIIDKIIDDKGILPNTGEKQLWYLGLIGTCLLITAYLGVKLKSKKHTKEG